MGATKFTRDEMLTLLESVKEVLPVGKKHWELVQKRYMTAHKEKVAKVNEDIKKSTGKEGTMKVTKRSSMSLEKLFEKLLIEEMSKGKYSGSDLTIQAKKIDKLINTKYGMCSIGLRPSNEDENEMGFKLEDDIEIESSDEEDLKFSGSRFQTMQEKAEAYGDHSFDRSEAFLKMSSLEQVN